jgi:hypothetical protein
MSGIQVHCYSGYRADQRPSRFTILDREYNVEEVDDQVVFGWRDVFSSAGGRRKLLRPSP